MDREKQHGGTAQAEIIALAGVAKGKVAINFKDSKCGCSSLTDRLEE